GYQKEWPFLLNAPTFGMPKFSHKK
ncbi:CoA pyrophosphatase, partial [Klebsiella pneumoniae]|nr:CoA pyrophosphatase [Klebsiella pneumoniae]